MLAMLLAGSACAGGPSSTSSEDAPAAATNGDLVTSEKVDGIGTVLADADGMTLYTTDAEDGGTIKCVQACADFWIPLAPDGESVPKAVDGVAGTFSVVERPDQTKQVALDGRPLYTFSEDRTPGSVRGNGFEDDFDGTHFVWTAATADGSTPDTGGSGESDGSGEMDYGY